MEPLNADQVSSNLPAFFTIEAAGEVVKEAQIKHKEYADIVSHFSYGSISQELLPNGQFKTKTESAGLGLIVFVSITVHNLFGSVHVYNSGIFGSNGAADVLREAIDDMVEKGLETLKKGYSNYR